MAITTPIQWADATWNPTTGCTKVSPGCKNCYAERFSHRLKHMKNPKYQKGFQLIIHPNTLDIPLKWRSSRKIFVNSMSDIFHESIPDDFLEIAFDNMIKADWHIFQILTKRPERMRYFLKRYPELPNHLWLGTSVELETYKYRIDIIRDIPVNIKFISFEPLIGPINDINLDKISWVIVGGESGPGHRPIEASWVREIRDQCVKDNVSFFFKQWGGRTPKAKGKNLDGKEWTDYPKQLTPILLNKTYK